MKRGVPGDYATTKWPKREFAFCPMSAGFRAQSSIRYVSTGAQGLRKNNCARNVQ
jgi:hypothetical protein